MRTYVIVMTGLATRSEASSRFQHSLMEELDRRLIDESQLEVISKTIKALGGVSNPLKLTPTGCYRSSAWWGSVPCVRLELILTRGRVLDE